MVVAVLPNLDKRGSSDVVDKLGSLFKNEGITAYLPDTIFGGNFEHAPEEELYRIADIIITVGGDGTIMRFAKRAAIDNKPVLGINAGRMGYLANIEQNELHLLSKLKNNEYIIENRMMLNVQILENGKLINEYTALNDAVITSGFISTPSFVSGNGLHPPQQPIMYILVIPGKVLINSSAFEGLYFCLYGCVCTKPTICLFLPKSD